MIADAFPSGVKPTAETGVYLVKSRSRPSMPAWRVDVTTYECRCEKGHYGKGAKFRAKNGYIKYEQFCHHLRDAIAYDGMLLRMMLEAEQLKK